MKQGEVDAHAVEATLHTSITSPEKNILVCLFRLQYYYIAIPTLVLLLYNTFII